MRLPKKARPKAPERYEDIVTLSLKRPGPLQKLRLILFMAGHPAEAERYFREARAMLVKTLGRNLYAEIAANPKKALTDTRKEIQEARRSARVQRREQRRLLARLADCERMMSSPGAVGEKHAKF
jgi:uncharacterized membrane protein